MRVTIVGSGYVGLVTGTCFAEMGNEVWCIDIDNEKIDNLKKGIIPIYEPGLEEMIKSNVTEGRLKFSTDLNDGLQEAEFAFIAVGTPPGEDGSADLQYVLEVARNIGRNMNNYLIVVDKSTVPVGTAEKVRAAIKEELNSRGKGDLEFDVVSNPEFLKEGAAIDDFMRPDRVVIGVDSTRAGEMMKELYSPFVKNGHPIIVMDIVSAELTKYAANAMLATRISFMNEISRLCEASGADVEMIRQGIGTDSRIGMPFLYAGLGYGGSCFPKDVKAIIETFKDHKLQTKILESVDKVNQEQRIRFVDKILDYFKGHVKDISFAIWGLSFKPQTDDMREAPAVDIINSLRDKGAKLKVYDPVAIEVAKGILGDSNIEYVADEYKVLEGVDVLLLLTDWHQFREPNFDKVKEKMKGNIIFDGRNQYNPKKIKELGFNYFSIGR